MSRRFLLNQLRKNICSMKVVADRMVGYDKQNIFTYFSLMAQATNSVNLGQGFPNFNPPQFLREYLSSNCLEGSLQYVPTSGAPLLLERIAEDLKPYFKRQYNPKTEIVISPGATTTLTCAFQAFINPGDEAIIIDPSFDYYRPQIEFAGGIPRGVPLKQKKGISKEEMKKRMPNVVYNSEVDSWDFDWERIEQTINEKTKLILINTPHNPTGKVVSQEEYDKLGQILEKYPHVLLIEDAAYFHIAFAPYKPFQIPLAINTPSLAHKTITICSAGKIFSSTGLRIGWAIGDEALIKFVKAANQYHVYCLNQPFQHATAQSLELCTKGDYFPEICKLYQDQCNKLIKILVESKLDVDLYVPQGGYFVISDISRIQVPEEYYKDTDGSTRSKSSAFCHMVCDKYKVIAIPLGTFYGKEEKHLGDNLVRWAFCKTTEDIIEAGKRLSQ